MELYCVGERGDGIGRDEAFHRQCKIPEESSLLLEIWPFHSFLWFKMTYKYSFVLNKRNLFLNFNELAYILSAWKYSLLLR